MSVADSFLPGGLIGADFTYNSTSAEEAHRKFPHLARSGFQPSSRGPLTKWTWLRAIWNLYQDGCYDSGALDKVIHSIYPDR